MRDEMAERVARAIYEKRNGHGCKPWSLQTMGHKAPYFDDARAALDTIKSIAPTCQQCGAVLPFDYRSVTKAK